MALSQRDMQAIERAFPGGAPRRAPAAPSAPSSGSGRYAEVAYVDGVRALAQHIEGRLADLETILLGGMAGTPSYRQWGTPAGHADEGGVLWHLRATVSHHTKLLQQHGFYGGGRVPDQRGPRGPF